MSEFGLAPVKEAGSMVVFDSIATLPMNRSHCKIVWLGNERLSSCEYSKRVIREQPFFGD